MFKKFSVGTNNIFVEHISISSKKEDICFNKNSFQNNGKNIDYFNPNSPFIAKHLGEKTCVFSDIDGKDKFSNYYKNCISIIGYSKDSKNNPISFLSHIDTYYIFQSISNEIKFEKLLKEVLDELLEYSSSKKDIDIFFAGGNYYSNNFPSEGRFFKQSYASIYLNALYFFRDIVVKNLSIYPYLISPPNNSIEIDNTHIYLDTVLGKIILKSPVPHMDKYLQTPILLKDEIDTHFNGFPSSRF